jgi:hypothetical protein
MGGKCERQKLQHTVCQRAIQRYELQQTSAALNSHTYGFITFFVALKGKLHAAFIAMLLIMKLACGVE